MYVLAKVLALVVVLMSMTVIRALCVQVNAVVKPLMLLDVDGILNILKPSIWGDQASCQLYHTINYSPKMIKQINKSRANLIEVQWLTWDERLECTLLRRSASINLSWLGIQL